MGEVSLRGRHRRKASKEERNELVPVWGQGTDPRWDVFKKVLAHWRKNKEASGDGLRQ